MFKAPLYNKVPSAEFDAWAHMCLQSKWEITLGAESYIEFESQEDCTQYNLAWYDPLPKSTRLEAAGYYCPYVPLTISGVITDPKTVQVIKIKTRYNIK